MPTRRLQVLIDDEQARLAWLAENGLTDDARVLANLESIAQVLDDSGLQILADPILDQLGPNLIALGDPDRALNNLERFVVAHHQQAEFPSLVSASASSSKGRSAANDTEAGTDSTEIESASVTLGTLLVLFSDSQFVTDILIRNFDVLLALRKSDGQQVTCEVLVARLLIELEHVDSGNEAMRVIRAFKQLEITRVAYGDLVKGHRLEQVTKQISYVAEACCQGACQWARGRLKTKWGSPTNASGDEAKYAIIAMGKLGGNELNYSSDIDLVAVFECDGITKRITMSDATKSTVQKTNREFFERLTRDVVRILSEATVDGPAYRVDLRLRPEGSRGKICASVASYMHYYDFQGRTWERQALIKAKPVAGDFGLGRELLDKLHPWIYRQNLNRQDIAGIKAIKRRIERKAIRQGEEQSNIKTGHGGIRDIEFVIQFLQLLNGGVIKEVQTPNTLTAIKRLESAGCLTAAETTLLTRNYAWLRKLEHRLQLMFDLQTHTLPASEMELRRTATRMGYSGELAFEEFQTELSEITEANRSILNHLLHGAFGMTFGSMRDSGGHLAFAGDSGDSEVPAEIDLVLEPEPDLEMITSVLEPFGFHDVMKAFQNLMELAKEKTPFLSPRRCHHFLAAIAPALLTEIGTTPDPDATLVSLATVSDSLGAKGVLWELFSFNRPTLSLYVRLCATSDYLAGILKSNPGMIDELMDAMVVDTLPDFEFLKDSMEELVRGAKDIEPIVHSFKNAQHLRVGVRDILKRDEIQNTHRTLADIAEVCLQTVARHEFLNMLAKHQDGGLTTDALGSDLLGSEGWIEACPFVILAMGKLGGKEPNYHSDLDVIFLYEKTEAFEAKLHAGVSSQYFFSELAAKITKFFNDAGGLGRLYELDSRLRPTGKSGTLAVSFDEFTRYFTEGEGWLWERQALCKARPIFGARKQRTEIAERVRKLIEQEVWKPEMAAEIAKLRTAMEQGCTERNLKRGVGGTVDVEFAIQALQLKHAREAPAVVEAGTLVAISRLVEAGLLDKKIGDTFASNYQLLRSIEARLRLINTSARHDFPVEGRLLKRLTFLLEFESSDELEEMANRARGEIRNGFTEVCEDLGKR